MRVLIKSNPELDPHITSGYRIAFYRRSLPVNQGQNCLRYMSVTGESDAAKAHSYCSEATTISVNAYSYLNVVASICLLNYMFLSN